MELISKEDIYNSIGFLKIPGKKFIVNNLFKMLKIDKINQLYEKAESGTDPQDSLRILLEQTGANYKIAQSDLDKLPETGPFILLSNHPYGSIDGIILAKVLGERYPEFKILVNYFLCRIKSISSYFIPVNPFENTKSFSSLSGLKSAINHIKEGKPLAIFPAGQVSAINSLNFKIEDIQWKEQIIKLCVHFNVPMFPVYFEGHNSIRFQIAGLIHPILRTALIPSELLNKSGKTIKFRIGDEIKKEDIKQRYTNNKELAKFLRAKSYELKYK